MFEYKTVRTVGELKKVIANMQDNTIILLKDMDKFSPRLACVEHIQVGFGQQMFRGFDFPSGKVENREFFCLGIRPEPK